MDAGDPRLRSGAPGPSRGSVAGLHPSLLVPTTLLAAWSLVGCEPSPEREAGADGERPAAERPAGENGAPTEAPGAPTLSVLTGHLRPPETGGGPWRLEPCGQEGARPLRDETDGALEEAWGWLQPPSDRPLFVELLVRRSAAEAPSGTENGTRAADARNGTADAQDGTTIPVAVAVRRAEHEGVRCREVERLRDLAFRGRGNEPFWLIDVAPEGIELREPEREQRFPPAEPRVHAAEAAPSEAGSPRAAAPEGAPRAPAPEGSVRALPDSVVYQVPPGPDREALRVTFVPDRCMDSMSGAWHAWRAEVRHGARALSGCAAEGGRSPVPLEPVAADASDSSDAPEAHDAPDAPATGTP